jgi:hypothetical protein
VKNTKEFSSKNLVLAAIYGNSNETAADYKFRGGMLIFDPNENTL